MNLVNLEPEYMSQVGQEHKIINLIVHKSNIYHLLSVIIKK